ncbi:MAG: DUF5131 family protein [Acidobacteriota bacterium]
MSENHWKEPIRWNAQAERTGPRHRVFCASMADIRRRSAARSAGTTVEVDSRNPALRLTIAKRKRPNRIANALPEDWGTGYDNVWLGTSVEDERVLGRVEHLRNVPAKVRFISLEPLIGALHDLRLNGIDWVIVGGESGPHARQMDPAWVLDIRQRCVELDVAVFFKRWRREKGEHWKVARWSRPAADVPG